MNSIVSTQFNFDIIRIFTIIKKVNFEAWVWFAGLTILAILKPDAHTHFTICPFRLMGIEWCPGCGLGRSISYLFHGNISASYHCHILGIPTALYLSARSVSLIRNPDSIIPKMLN